MFPLPDEPPEAVREIMERCNEEVLEALQGFGLYVEGRMVQAVEGAPGEELVPVLILSGNVGSVAFSDRVQRPEAERDREIVDEIAELTVSEEFERKRRKLLGLDE